MNVAALQVVDAFVDVVVLDVQRLSFAIQVIVKCSLDSLGTLGQSIHDVLVFGHVVILVFDVVVDGCVCHHRIGPGAHHPWTVFRRIAAIVIGY